MLCSSQCRRGYCRPYDGDKLAGRAYGSLRARLAYPCGNALREFFLAVFVNYLFELFLRVPVYNVSRAQGRCGIHPHVERRIRYVRKSSLGCIELMRRHAEVEQHPVKRADAERGAHALHFREVRPHDRCTVAEWREPCTRRRDGLGVAVYRYQPSRRKTCRYRR